MGGWIWYYGTNRWLEDYIGVQGTVNVFYVYELTAAATWFLSAGVVTGWTHVKTQEWVHMLCEMNRSKKYAHKIKQTQEKQHIFSAVSKWQSERNNTKITQW